MSKKNAVLRDKPLQELESQLVELKSNLAKERSHAVSGTKSEKPAKIRTMRRGIARILTIMGEKKVTSQG